MWNLLLLNTNKINVIFIIIKMKKVLNYYKPEHDFFLLTLDEKCSCLAEASGTVSLTLTLYSLIHWKSNRVRGLPFFVAAASLGSQPVSLQMIGSCVTRPSSLLAPSHWTTAVFIFPPHWTSRAGDELILVKYSCAREGLKIGRYIKPAVEPR